ncbi:antitoxin VapB family protein [Candidatus Pyrohabitans sp.]
MKTIMVRDEVYRALSKMKREGESFSSVIERLIAGKRDRALEVLERYAGSLKETDLLDLIMEERKRFTVREFDL